MAVLLRFLGLLSYQAGKLYTDSPLRISAVSLVGGEAVYGFELGNLVARR